MLSVPYRSLAGLAEHFFDQFPDHAGIGFVWPSRLNFIENLDTDSDFGLAKIWRSRRLLHAGSLPQRIRTMKNPIKAMGDYVTNNGNSMRDCWPPGAAIAKVFLVATSPVVGVAALFQKQKAG
jgi:hypothetical protein